MLHRPEQQCVRLLASGPRSKVVALVEIDGVDIRERHEVLDLDRLAALGSCRLDLVVAEQDDPALVRLVAAHQVLEGDLIALRRRIPRRGCLGVRFPLEDLCGSSRCVCLGRRPARLAWLFRRDEPPVTDAAAPRIREVETDVLGFGRRVEPYGMLTSPKLKELPGPNGSGHDSAYRGAPPRRDLGEVYPPTGSSAVRRDGRGDLIASTSGRRFWRRLHCNQPTLRSVVLA